MTKRPFSNDYVIRETLKHMRKCVEISQRKTLARMQDFKDDPEANREFLVALSNLNKLQKLVDSIVNENKEMIGD